VRRDLAHLPHVPAAAPLTGGRIELPLEESPILEVLITLAGSSRAPVWRRVLVTADMRLDRFHDVIQTAVGWRDLHPHQFWSETAEYGPADPERDHRDEREVTIGELLPAPGGRVRYAYGEDRIWEHSVLLERRLSPDPAELYPTCLDGAGACPPEDREGGRDEDWGHAEPGGAVGREESIEDAETLARVGEREQDARPGFDLERAREALAFLSGVP
jgi:hypothetical protein